MSVAVSLRKFKSVLISQFSSFRLFLCRSLVTFISRTSRLFGADIVLYNKLSYARILIGSHL